MQETQVGSLGWEDSLEKWMATHSSILAWRIPWTEEPDGLQSMEAQRVWHNWEPNTFTFFHIWLVTTAEAQKKHFFLSHTQASQAAAMLQISSIQFSSFAQSFPTLCNPMDHSTPVFSVQHQSPEPAQTHVHRISDAIQPSHPLSSPSPAFSLSQYHSLFQWVRSLHQMAKVLKFQLHHQSFKWIFRADFL